MPDAHYDLGLADRLKAEALGRPGQRRFRILVEGPGGSAVVWLEKEDLHTLAISIARLLEVLADQAPRARSRRSAAAGPYPAASAAPAPLDFQAVSWTLGYDEDQDALEFQASDQDEAAAPRIRFTATRQQGKALSEEALKVYAAGRPVCPLCGASLDPGETHTCPRSNGHLAHA